MARAMQVMPNARFVLTPPPKAYTAQQNTPACARAHAMHTGAPSSACSEVDAQLDVALQDQAPPRRLAQPYARGGAGRGGAGRGGTACIHWRPCTLRRRLVPVHTAIAKKALKKIVVAKCAFFFL